MSNTFTIGSVTLRLAREFFNEAFRNERSLEVVLGRWFLNRFPPSPGPEYPIETPIALPVIEVGCVLPYYNAATSHEVIDLADEHPSSRKINALSMHYSGRNVLSISTIEHMQSKEYGNTSDEDSITFLRRVYVQADNYLVTWGIGYNPTLDAWVKAHPEVPRTFMKRTNWKNEYAQVAESDEVWATQFGHSDRPPIPNGFNNANVVVVVTNLPELLSQ